MRVSGFRSIFAVACGLLTVWGTGCCAPKRPASASPAPLHLFIEPVEIEAPIRHLRFLQSSVPPLTKDEETKRIGVELADIQKRIEDELAQRLNNSRYLVVPDRSSADISLRLRVVAYGRVPGKWVAFLVGSGVVEAVVQGAVVERLTHNQWLALGVGGEELLSECVTWLGGAFVTNRYLTPMIFQAKVSDVRDQKRLWHRDEASIYSHGAVSKLPKEKRRSRADQLQAAENAVIDKLVKALNGSADRIEARLSS